MDSPHAIGFYASSAVALGGGLVVVFAGERGLRALAVLIAGVGVAGVYASLSAGFAALVVLASFAASALVLARPDYRAVMGGAAHVRRQLAAVARRSCSRRSRTQPFVAISPTSRSTAASSGARPSGA